MKAPDVTEVYVDGFDEPVKVIPEPRFSALFAYPVILLGTREQIPNLHCTAAYIRDVRTYHNFDEPPVGFISKDEFLSVRGSIERIGAGIWQIADVVGIDAFGEDQSVPVLKVFAGAVGGHNLQTAHRGLVEEFNDLRIGYSADFEYSPHVTVPLKVLVDPPKQVLLGPMELWYCDDEPEVI